MAQKEIEINGESFIVKYYYLRDYHRAPLMTVCLMFNKGLTKLSRGISLCSKKETPCKETGRHIAECRAREALTSNGTAEECNKLLMHQLTEDKLEARGITLSKEDFYLLKHKTMYCELEGLSSNTTGILRDRECGIVGHTLIGKSFLDTEKDTE